MFANKLCVFALLLCASTIRAHNNKNSKGHLLYSGEEIKNGLCEKDADCQNGGKCALDKVKHENKCECIFGTHGDHCEIVDGCVETPSKCGDDPSVKCVFNTQSWNAECQCVDSEKAFDDQMKICRTPCKSDKDCDDTWCRKMSVWDGFGFCRCPWGKAGDRCDESVDECKKIGLDCSDNPNITCAYFDQGVLYPKETYCKCPERLQGYDYVEKVCKDCDCGVAEKFDCSFDHNGSKTCFCDLNHYQKDGVCQACNCGEFALSCKQENGTKVCDCYGSYKENGFGHCQECECEDYNAECSFENHAKVCNCKDGYFKGDDNKCHGGCNIDTDCSNGGRCRNRLCQCLPGTKGDKCEIVEPCFTIYDTWKLCGQVVGVKCAFNQTVRQPYCACADDNYGYDAKEQKCKEKCGNDNVCKNGAKCVQEVCRCLPGTKGDRCEIIDICETESDLRETCGDLLARCVYNQTSHLVFCTCKYPQKYAYDPLTKQCKSCGDCGKDARCVYDVTQTICVCNEGFSPLNNTCAECVCGLHGKCSYKGIEKVCDCDEGYEVKDGTCKDTITTPSVAPSSETTPSISSGTGATGSDSTSRGTTVTSGDSTSRGTTVSDVTSTDKSGDETTHAGNQTPWKTGTIVLGVLLAVCLIGGVALLLKFRSGNYESVP